MPRAILFPGQGAQYVGMGQDLFEALAEVRALYARASEVLGLDLARVSFLGPEEELIRTHICQPAILVHSLAALHALGLNRGDREHEAGAGLSLGELTALAWAGAFEVETAIHVVSRRGALMQEACEAAPGGMAAPLGLDREGAEALADRAREGDVLVVANYNAPGQYVLSGSAAALDRAEALAREHGARRFTRFKVAGAYHSPLMRPAAEAFARELAACKLRQPHAPVCSNVSGGFHGGPDEIREAIVAQVASPVRWEDNVRTLAAAGVNEADEVGPGAALKGLVRAVERGIAVESYGTLEEMER